MGAEILVFLGRHDPLGFFVAVAIEDCEGVETVIVVQDLFP